MGMCYQTEMLLKMQEWITEIQLKLVRDIRKERKGFLKHKINIRRLKKVWAHRGEGTGHSVTKSW